MFKSTFLKKPALLAIAAAGATLTACGGGASTSLPPATANYSGAIGTDSSARNGIASITRQSNGTQTAVSSDAFVESIGINTHFVLNHAPYGTQFSQVESLLLASGIRHYRDNVNLMQHFQTRILSLGANGLHGEFIMKSSYAKSDILNYPSFLGQSFEAFENPNEQDDQGVDNWLGTAKSFERSLYSWVKSDPATARYPVYGASMAWPHDYAQFGDMSRYMDYGNLHDYMANYNPGIPDGGPWGGIHKMLADERMTSANKPVIATESGYSTSQGTYHVDDRTDVRYVTRLFFEQFNAGIARTYFYDFLDNSASANDSFKTYGLVRRDLTPKPAYAAVKSLISALSDPGPAFEPAALNYSLSGPDSVHHLLMQKRDGSYILALWNEVPSWNPNGGGDIEVPVQNVTIASPAHFSSVKLSTMDDNGVMSTGAIPWSGSQTTVGVTDKVSLVTLQP